MSANNIERRVSKIEKTHKPKDGGINNLAEFLTAMYDGDNERFAIETPYMKSLSKLLDKAIPDELLDKFILDEELDDVKKNIE